MSWRSFVPNKTSGINWTGVNYLFSSTRFRNQKKGWLADIKTKLLYFIIMIYYLFTHAHTFYHIEFIRNADIKPQFILSHLRLNRKHVLYQNFTNIKKKKKRSPGKSSFLNKLKFWMCPFRLINFIYLHPLTRGGAGEGDSLFSTFRLCFFNYRNLFLQIVQLFAERSQTKSRGAVSDCCLLRNSELNCSVLYTLTGCRQGGYQEPMTS